MIGYSAAWLLLALPLAGLLLNTFAGRLYGKSFAGAVASAAVGASFLVAAFMAPSVYGHLDHNNGSVLHLWDWINIGELQVPLALLIDPLSLTMVLVVTGVGFLIHIYAMGYMAEDSRFTRFFIYLNFFILAMLLLVLGDSFVTLFIGWEGVGLASFLLIGFWFDREDELYGSYADCGKKAFVVNRIGDVGLILAMGLIWTTVGTLSFEGAFQALETTAGAPVVLICLLLLLAVAGKSAQFPLYVWLPDAMAGPTPVSALIHAATMVTAGIYLMARTNVLWEMAPAAGTIAAWVGVGTAFVAATMAMVQTDLKKVLAYSTISQLGYMVLGAGVGAFALAIFHLVTHAFFKALLFLSAGSVQHATHELDMRKLGGLRLKMPHTSRNFLIGSLALAGVPPLAGFFSKDSILLYAFQHNILLYALGLITALTTAIYIFRAYYLTFMGRPRDPEVDAHVHESGKLILWPLWILSALTILGGVLNLPFVLTLEHALAPVVGELHPPGVQQEILLMVVSAVIAIGGARLAWSAYHRRTAWVDTIRATFKPLGKLAQQRWYVDELYDRQVLRGTHWLSYWLAFAIDQQVIDRIVNWNAETAMAWSRSLRRLNDGLVPTYAFSVFIGATVLMAYFWLAT